MLPDVYKRQRYDPSRRAALNAAMQERRKNITVGKISNGMRKEAFDGMQKDWSEQGIPKVISSWRVDLSEMIFADKPIPAVIARAIDSNNPAPITAFVERNVYAEEGRNVIIPAGSRLMGTLGSVTASSEATSESARVQISWERLVRPDGSISVSYTHLKRKMPTIRHWLCWRAKDTVSPSVWL